MKHHGKRFVKRTAITLSLLAVLVLGIVLFGPSLAARLFGPQTTQWISERFSETLREKSDLVVYEVEFTGKETVSTNAWLIGTVQKVEMPYTFTMNFSVDLSKASVTANETVIEVHVPAPEAGYPKLTVDEENVKKTDFFYRLTPERFEQMQRETEQKLFEECKQNEDYAASAWDNTVKVLETLFRSVAEQSFMGSVSSIQIIKDSAE